MKLIPLSGKHGVGKFTKVSNKDYPYLKKYAWYGHPGRRTLYARANISGSHILMHRFIMKTDDSNLLVDHRNRIGLDNQRRNLRVCANEQNRMNSYAHIDSTSKFNGVSWDKSNKKWIAKLQKGGEVFWGGRFDTEIDAARKYNKMASKRFGKFANLNKV